MRDAFLHAGYTLDNWVKAAVKALAGTEWHHSKIAHGLGGSTSGTRGGTHEDIQACADHLIHWAQTHPAPEKKKPKKGYSGSTGPSKEWKKDEDPEGSSGGGSLGTGHLASWITGVPAWYSHRTD